ncbi:imidazolonepropionase (plasmid) [Azospirillum oryzae]|uniref:Imidazolonepropionase n=1 Tax=Azospirillum oryzae TaxID=286727 RepID=A0A6N1ACM5_9PROT|nr:imidazolonepropionase [Azospirillum oryzae]KAA0588178.1 imidazolonepropionase [Azospirillum oryzae]QKS49220.1 imidazolonepropionase [Azospirillum oryzae]GLR82023.1 imidazolonepropionase [Azospirillum oryzae]
MPTSAPWDSLWIDLSVATMDGAAKGDADGYGAIADAAVGIKDGRIAFVGRRADLTDAPDALATEVHSGQGGWMTPGLIDCHTHLVYGGNRAREFEMRLNGATYEEIARAGGGILSTVTATRAASEDQLLAATLPRLDSLLAEGVTTVEVKSGYGLDTETETRMLCVARRLAQVRPVEVRTTYLGAHALPPEFKGDADGYIDRICDETLPAIAEAGLADAVDAFCEGIGFSVAQTRRVFETAKRLGLPVKLHAEQLSNLGGARLVAEFGGLSADHIEHLDEEGVVAMANAGTVAVLLPGAFYALRETKLPPIDLLRRHGVPMALSTDNNPGTSPVTSLLLMLSMGCTFFRLTPAEALAGITRHAAKALGLTDRGVIARAKRADLAVWRIEHPAELAYAIGLNPCMAVVNGGVVRKPHVEAA